MLFILNVVHSKCCSFLQALIGAKQMFMLKVGSNITSLREFTALCKLETIPLKKYLLGNHLGKDEGPRSSKKARKHGQETMVEEMGGVQALGKVSSIVFVVS
jgi:hypothetical protein